MQYVGKVFSTVSQLYKELNPATLTGAIDVVVVEDAQGELRCSPFHVRFGKLQLLRPSDKAVQVIVNARIADFYMKVGDSGEGFFVVETDADVPSQFATSPVTSPALSFCADDLDPDFLDLGSAPMPGLPRDGYVSAHESADEMERPESDEPASPALPPPLTTRPSRLPFLDDMALGSSPRGDGPLLHRLDDGAKGPISSPRLRSTSTVSDSAYELETWGKRHSETSSVRTEGPHRPPALDDGLLHADWDWGVRVTPPPKTAPPPQHESPSDDDHKQAASEAEAGADDNQAAAEPSTADSPAEVDAAQVLRESLDMSLCGMATIREYPHDSEAQREMFDSARVTASQWRSGHAAQMLADPDLVFRVHGDKYVQGSDLLVSLVSHLAFGDEQHTPLAEPPSDSDSDSDSDADDQDKTPVKTDKAGEGRRWWRWGSQRTVAAQAPPTVTAVNAAGDLAIADRARHPDDSVTIDIRQPAPIAISQQQSATAGSFPSVDDDEALGSGYMSDDGRVPHPITTARTRRHYAKTLRLTSDQLRSLNLRAGSNDVKFLVPSNNAYCEARIFLYRHDTQIVISDIDGTITKSDALGHLFNMVGKDWTHHGVAKLYTDIVNNGYEILYLTSRAIGQADGTRYFLSNVKQGEYKLPLGPLLLSPDRLFTSFHREVIMRRPHEFKMACLRDIRNLFGPDQTLPFYAGFGNRISDAMSYRSVNVPVSRICTIDSSGEIKLDLLPGYRSSYVDMNDLVDMMFPALSSKLDPQFNDWEYWKPSLPAIDDELAQITAELVREEEELRRQQQQKQQQQQLAKKKSDDPALSKAALEPPVSPTTLAGRRDSQASGLASSPPTDHQLTPVRARQTMPTSTLRQRADSWTPSAAERSSAKSPETPSRGRMGVLKKVSAFSPFSLVRGTSSLPPPKFDYEPAQGNGSPNPARPDQEDQFPALPHTSASKAEEEQNMSVVTTFSFSQTQEIHIRSGPTSAPIEHDDADERVAEDPAVAEAALRLIPQFDRDGSETPGATRRIDSNYSFRTQEGGSEYDDDAYDDEEIDQETLAIMHDMEEVQRL